MKDVLLDIVGTGGSLDSFKEGYFEMRSSIVGVFEGGRLEKLYRGSTAGISFRLVEGDSVRFGSTSDLGGGSVGDMARSILGFGGALKLDVDRSFLEIQPSDHEKVLEFMSCLDRDLWKVGSYIKQVRLTFSEGIKRFCVANSMGFSACDGRPYFTAVVELVGEKEGYVQTFRESYGGTFRFEDADTDSIQERFIEAAKKLLELLDAPSSPKGRMPVVISGEAGGTLIHEAVGHGLEADLVYRGVSVYRGRLGDKVASSKVSVVDDPTMSGMRGSYIYDDEGTRARRNVLIEKGVLKGYLSDLRHIGKVEGALPGNGRREDYSHIPIPRMSNTFIDKGSDPVDSMVKDIDLGLFVKKMGGGQVNTVNGDFVFDVLECYLIEKGSISHMVKGATLLGNGPKVLMDIDMVGDDLSFSIGTCGKDGQGVPVSDGQPTIRVPEMLVGGKE